MLAWRLMGAGSCLCRPPRRSWTTFPEPGPNGPNMEVELDMDSKDTAAVLTVHLTW